MDVTTEVLHIQFLGGCYISRNGVALPNIDTTRLQAFLCYLLVYAQKPQPRQQIALVLWSDSTEAQARTNLRKYLHHLRHALHDVERFLSIDAHTIQWRGDASVVVDIHEFERCLVESGKQKETGQYHNLAATLRRAIALYQGSLLPVCYDDWITVPRERIANQYFFALNELVALLENQQDYQEAIFYAHKLLEHDSLNEASYQRLINLYALAGHHSRATELYYQCVDVLKQELDLEPSAETQALFERVKTTHYNRLDSHAQPSERSIENLEFSGHPDSYLEQLTVIFTDIAGFSQLSETHNSTVLFTRLNEYMNLLNQIIQEGNGRVVKRMGDGILAVFAQPLYGLRAAYAIQKALRGFNQIDSQNDVLPFYTRIGVATGDVSVVYLTIEGKREFEIMGNRVNTATRLQRIAPINGIVLDQLTYTSCEAVVDGKVSQTTLMVNGGEEQVYIVKPEFID